MEVKFSVYGDRLVFYLSGELDEHYAKGVKDYMETIIGKNPKINCVIFNMAGLIFMDSTGIGMLLGRYKKLKKQGVRCFIEQPTVSVEKVIELSGIYEVIPKI
ncbi:MAG: anti-sigma factor antagonist [Clostridia bacterium]|nr:anti-sigma factor antagonist [Clostridia bacterium]